MAGARAEAVVRSIFEDWRKPQKPCSECPLRDPDGAVPLFGIGSWSSPTVFVAMTPGEERSVPGPIARSTQADISFATFRKEILGKYWDWADENKEPGKWRHAGLFDKMLAPLQIARRDVYFTNACKCAHIHGKDAENAGATELCAGYLSRELAVPGLRLVVAFGGDAARATLLALGMIKTWEDSPPITRLHGHIRKGQKGLPILLTLLHWSNADANMTHTDFSDLTYYESCTERFFAAAKEAGLFDAG